MNKATLALLALLVLLGGCQSNEQENQKPSPGREVSSQGDQAKVDRDLDQADQELQDLDDDQGAEEDQENPDESQEVDDQSNIEEYDLYLDQLIRESDYIILFSLGEDQVDVKEEYKGSFRNIEVPDIEGLDLASLDSSKTYLAFMKDDLDGQIALTNGAMSVIDLDEDNRQILKMLESKLGMVDLDNEDDDKDNS